MAAIINALLIGMGPIFLLFVYCLIQEPRQRHLNVGKKQVGMRCITHLRKLLEYVPQHRGMTNAQLQGDSSFKAKIKLVQQTITENIILLKKERQQLIEWNIEHRLQCIESDWHTISTNYQRYDASFNFTKHTALVAEILLLLNEISEESGILSPQSPDYQTAYVASNDLPLLTELLGQSRGIGTGIAARGKQLNTDKVKLLYRYNKINAVISSLSNNLQTTSAQDKPIDTHAKMLLNTCKDKTTEFMQLLQNDIINSKSINIQADTFYAAGSDAINCNFSLLDAMFELIQSRINNEIQSCKRQQHWSYSVTTAILGSYLLILHFS